MTDVHAAEPVSESAAERMSRLMDGYLTTQLLYVAAKLGIADVLASGPLTGRPGGSGAGRRGR